jgi:hypothetical protein
VTPVRDFAMTVEATYGLKPTPGLVLQPENARAIGLNVIVIP